MEVKVWSYLKEYETNKEEIIKAITDVLESGVLILGEKGRELERQYSKYIGTKYAVGCDNGTNAIVLALRALGKETKLSPFQILQFQLYLQL